jgi:hypothetical protein
LYRSALDCAISDMSPVGDDNEYKMPSIRLISGTEPGLQRMITHLPMVHKRRGNPNWGKPILSAQAVPTEFEGMVLRLGLTKETYSSSSQLRIWCERNSNRCYVPEWLLKEWGIMPDVGWS